MSRAFGSIDGERLDLGEDKQGYQPLHQSPDGPAPGRGRRYWLSYATVMCINFVGMVDYSVIMPSAQGYCRHLNAPNMVYGIILAVYPLARISTLSLAGLLADLTSMRAMLLISVSMMIVGDLCYGLADAGHSAAFMILGRAVAGIGSTNMAAVQKFVVETSSIDRRSQAIAVLQAIGLSGMAVGPALNFGIADANFRLFGSVWVNEYTGAGFVLAVLNGVCLLMVVLFFSDAELPDKPEDKSPAQSGGCCGLCCGVARGFAAVWRTPGALTVTISAMLAMLWFSVLDTLIPPVLKDSFGWDLKAISLFFGAVAVVVAAMMICVGILSKWIPDRCLMLGSACFYAAVVVVIWFKLPTTHSATHLWFYMMGLPVLLGFCCQNAPSMALFTKLMSGAGFEGLSGSVALTMQGLGRTLGPLIAGATLDHGGLRVCAGVLLGLTVMQSLLLLSNWGKLDPESELNSPFFTPNHSPNPSFAKADPDENKIMKTPNEEVV